MKAVRSSKPTPDQAAAHELLCELRTRISTQPLPYQYGVEARALESLWEIFGHARMAMKNHSGCVAFASETTRMLNVDLRPVTAKWHRALSEGQLNSRDGANEFRADLESVQEKLRVFARKLHEMAYGISGEDQLMPAPFDDAALQECLGDLAFGIPTNAFIANTTVAAINKSEADAVNMRRDKYSILQDGNNAVGLGLSGGGIRSATFCLGVTQVLAERGLLKDVDFLSTVSGGGYLGAFLSRRLTAKESHAEIAAPHGPDSESIRYLRVRAKYLTAANLKEQWTMVTATFAGMILNWSAPLFFVAASALIAVVLGKFGRVPWEALLALSCTATAVALVFYGVRMRLGQQTGGRLLGALTAATLSVALLWLLATVYEAIIQLSPKWELTSSIVVAAIAAAAPAIIRFIPIFSKPAIRRIALKVMLIAAGLIIPVGAIAVTFLFYNIGNLEQYTEAAVLNPLRYFPGWVVLGVLAVMFGFMALIVDVNLTAPHRLYRDKLARTFIHSKDGGEDPVSLTAINPTDYAPYHLINAAANLPSSSNVALRERRSDFFLFSKYWCGAPSVGYTETEHWLGGKNPIDLATAIAVSGGAVSPNMGLGSMPSLRALLTFLNVRLGFWIRRPDEAAAAKPPGFVCLIREMFGIAMSEKQAWINLSDGGHIENMAVYELLRRRCKFIISVDGEADPESMFHGHLTLVRHAQIDFGIRIEPNLAGLRPDLTSRFSQSHAMLCRVHYPRAGDQPAGTGLILYLKLSVTGNELELIKTYRALNPDFPHQATLDQFFDEEQFEAYRQLGVHVAEGLFHSALVGSRPTSVSDWFTRLASNLLLPGR